MSRSPLSLNVNVEIIWFAAIAIALNQPQRFSGTMSFIFSKVEANLKVDFCIIRALACSQ